VLAVEEMPEEHLVACQGLPVENQGDRPSDVIAKCQGFKDSEVGWVNGNFVIRFSLGVDGKNLAHL